MAFEDEDDLNKWLASQQAPNTATPDQSGASGSGVWANARALMDKQNAMQYQPQDYSKLMGKPEAEPNRTGHDFKTILAMALDLFGNKGKGAGQLMAAGNQSFDQKEAAWKRENGPQAMLARQMQVKQLEGADRQAFNQDRAQLGSQIGQEVQLAGAQQGQQNSDRTFARQEERDMAGDVQHQMDQDATHDYQNRSLGQTRELQEAQMKQSAELQRAQLAASNANAAASRGQAATFHNDAMRQHDADQEFNANEALNRARDAEASQRRGFEHSDEAQDKSLDAQRMIHELTHPAPAAPAGYRIADPVAFKPVSGNAGTMSKIYEKSGNAKQIQASIDELTRLRSEPGSEANKRLYDATIKTLIGDRSQEGSTGVLSGTEFERYIKDLPEYGVTGNLSSWRGALDTFQGRDPALETLAGFKDRFKKSNAAEFGAYGLSPVDEEKPQQSTVVSRYPGLKLVQ